MDPEIAVIIPHYEDPARLRRCLDALAAQDPAPDVEIVVVDNGSTADLSWVAAEHPRVRLVTEEAKGAGPARNRGVAETRARLLFFVDADCVPDADWVEAGRRAMAEGAEILGGAVGTFDETPPPRSGAQAFEAVLAFNFQRYIEVVGFTGAGNLLTRREIFEATGGFRPAVSEDIDWSRRATALGYRIAFAPEVRVVHPTRTDWPALRRKWLRMTREGFRLRQGRPRARLAWALRAVAVLASPMRDVPRFLLTDRLSGAGERTRGIATLLRLRALRARWMLAQAMGREIA